MEFQVGHVIIALWVFFIVMIVKHSPLFKFLTGRMTWDEALKDDQKRKKR